MLKLIMMTIKPKNYDLTFEPDFKKFTFKGQEILTFEVVMPTKKIELDAAELKIKKCNLYSSSEWNKSRNSRQARTLNRIPSFKSDEKSEKLVINLSNVLKPGKYKLIIYFEGILNDKLAGFYRSKYIDSGKEKYLATTQFEAADAKRAFPCIDHPAYKATFDVTFIIDKHLTVVSNTVPLLKPYFPTAPVGKRMVKFERTPLMSTYLLYLGVGEFEFIEDKYKDVQLRVVTTSGKSKYGKFALECTKKFLKYYEEYFDYPYPLKKLDLLAIPDFASGAMENWGAITFRENALLVYPGLSSKATLQRVAEVVAHELVHQWFGNLVTMKWWDDLWLNESFATYLAYKAMDHFWPEWKVWTDYLSQAVFGAMSLDAMKSTRSISSKILDVHEIDENFDEIAYEKGGSVLRMIDEYLGHDSFRDGLRRYIKKFTYKNAEAKDLWRSLDNATAKPITKIMQTYTMQKGFPLVKAQLRKTKLQLSQKRFLYLDAKDSSLWVVPLVIANQKKDQRRLLDKEIESVSWIEQNYAYINKNYGSFFLSSYDEELLRQLGKNIKDLNELETIGLIHDLFSLVISNQFNLDHYIHFVDTYFKDEKRVEVLQYLMGKLNGIYFLLKDEKLKKSAIYFAAKSLKMTGFVPKKNEDVNITFLRNAALSTLNSFDNNEVRKFIENQFKQFIKNGKLHPDLRAVVFLGIVWIDGTNYKKIKELYEKSQIQEEKAKYLMAMGNSKSKEMIQNSLDYGLTNKVRFADLFYLIVSTSRNIFGTETSYDWLIKNWQELKKRTGGHSTVLLRRLLKMIIPIGAINKVNNAVAFLNKNKIIGLEKTYNQIIEELQINSKFIRKYKA